MKNVLLYMVDFYSYRLQIVNELENQNCDVTWLPDEVKLNSFERIVSKLSPKYKSNKFDKYFTDSLNQIKNKSFDLILIIFAGNFFRKKHIDKLKLAFPNSEIVYYAWDSISNFPSIEELIVNADRAYSFDEDDCIKTGCKFLPLFYHSKECGNETIKYDVSSVMSFFLEKVTPLNNLLDSLPNDIDKFFHLRIRDKFYRFQLSIKGHSKIDKIKQYFSYNSLSFKETNEIINSSRVILDCPLPGQKGLSMRTFEALSKNKKLITTNSSIKKYDFYCEQNIFVLEKDNVKVPIEFFRTPFDETYSLSVNYSIQNFIKILIGN